MFDGLLNNKILRATMLSRFRNSMQDNDVRALVLYFDNNGELQNEPITGDDLKVIAPDEYKACLQAYEKSITSK